ncbi:hypothetical protein ABZ354_06685 [Streptomyces sp. NPDC005925]|uniref:hypothetical protein n=1 Tax=Streptomyces sp. NPDC005925 TaxID=3157172 RepID=UPI0033DCC5C5
MNNWREDAQPEWPAAAFATRELPTVAGETVTEAAAATGAVTAAGPAEDGVDGVTTRAFPAPPGTGVRPDTTWPGSPRRDVRHRLTQPAERTEVLPRTDPARQFPEPDAFGAGPGRPRDPWGQDGYGAAGNPCADARVGMAADPHVGPSVTPYVDASVDPHEVTVQLDAVQLGDGLIRRAAGRDTDGRPAPGGRGGQDVSDRPVFVDESGRRSRLYRRIGMAVAVACAVYAVVIVATLLSGSSDAPWLPVPGQPGGQPAGRVDTTPLPDESTLPAGTGTGSPGPGGSASPGDRTSPLPGTSAGASGLPAGPDGGPGTSGDPRPAETRTTAGPGNGGADPAPTKLTPPPDTGAPEPGPEPTEPTAEPTETTGDSGAPAPAAGIRAAGPADTAPPAASSPQEQGAHPSPEYVL